MSLTPKEFHALKGQRILIIEPFFWTPHIETALELAELLSKNNTVTFVGPDILRCTTDETYTFPSRVLINFSRKRHVSDYLSDHIRRLHRLELSAIEKKPSSAEIPRIIDLAKGEIEALRFEKFDLGTALQSSLITRSRKIDVVPKDHPTYALGMARDSIWLYQLTKQLIRREHIDIVAVFNGRFAPVRAIRRACEGLGTRYFVHERGSSLEKYAIYDCATPHRPSAYRDWVDAWWSFADDPEENARQFLNRRRQGMVANWYSFTRKQQQGKIPLPSNRKRITFFTSSEDEFVAIGDELKPDSPFCDQVFSIRSIGAACRERGYEFIVRFHPNTPRSAARLLNAAHEAAETVVEPRDSIDSYALADSSEVVISQNSTIAIESAAGRKPAFYTGRSIFEQCRSVRRIKKADEISEALDGAPARDPLDALKFANYLAIHGIPYRYYMPKGVLTGTYQGKDLNSPLATLRKLKLLITRGSP